PPPDETDVQQRMDRQPMGKGDRRALLRSFLPGIFSLVVIYILVTILREIRDSFMADMWRESGVALQAGVFAKTETTISAVILVLIAAMIWLRNNFKAFMLAQGMMLAGFIIALAATILYQRMQ